MTLETYPIISFTFFCLSDGDLKYVIMLGSIAAATSAHVGFSLPVFAMALSMTSLPPLYAASANSTA